MEIKPQAAIAAKWKTNAGQAGPSYAAGVNNPRRSWAASAAAADDARKAGLAAADARDAFRQGVQAAGDARWKANAVALGTTRYPQGVSNAEPRYTSGFAKYHGVISGLTLPPRGAKGSPENIERVRIIAAALHQAKNTA